ncbi:MAG: tRNA (adenosine(37)-N6)-dimethylallyltransferase MiaA [Candidatus Neomarinimicrobiota bacterium]
MKSIITIVGPTASGKTSLAIETSKLLDGEIISLDSRQIYKGMEIGTAQPTKIEQDISIHHLVGIRNPNHPIAAGEYAKLVKDKIAAIKLKSKLPIICGGAGLYYRVLKKGLFVGSSMDSLIRKELEQSYDNNPRHLFDQLKKIDPKYAEIVHLNNKKRMVRALEIYKITGKSPSEHFKKQKESINENTLKLYTVYLLWERKTLIKRITKRTKEMLKNGWIKEVENLIKEEANYESAFPALNSIGYTQIRKYLMGKLSYDEMEEIIIIKTRQFARRQSQWFSKEKIDLIIEMDGMSSSQSSLIIKQLYKN